MYFDRRGNGQKPPRTKPFRQKTPGQNPREQLTENLYKGLLSGFFTRPTKNRAGGPRCVTYILGGGLGMCDRGEGSRVSKLAKNSVTYFNDGRPLNIFTFCTYMMMMMMIYSF